MTRMRRREFITLLGGAAAAWRHAVRAQQPALPTIGFITLGSQEASASFLAGFRTGLGETGHIEGRNVVIEYRFARNESDRLAEWMADYVRRRVAVIVASGYLAAFAAKAATTTIPVVFGTGGNPVQTGLVSSLNRPGGNLTGATTLAAELGAKRLGLLHELIPSATRFAVLINPTSPNAELLTTEAQTASAALRMPVDILTASNIQEIDNAFASLAQSRPAALVINGNTLFNNRRVQIVTLATYHRIPTMFENRASAQEGGLMSYGAIRNDYERQIGIYAGRILKGEKAADLPVVQGAKFEFVINLRTARTLGITVPPTLLAIADEVIE
jgi:putative tryptophan/tyrosine transport system substrate-binding protein